ncbi:predicted GPI-anchored protein 58 [Triticum urartu]|uniref:predicted GPI-anchored protein 58 n=1 Tax=Triticum urartu TaxID=4572 RepID=UPI002042D31F|nr:predicted GPI-anchored protein 58 [Triticum urartu]XP_048574616.1 predicted GPI-anchored protein 58 [Triticum urartu]
MEPTRSPLVLLVAQAVLAAAMLQQPSEGRVQAVAPSAPHLAGGKEAEAAAATSSPASPFTGDTPLVLLVAYAVLAEAMLQPSETRVQAATSSPSSQFTGDPPRPSLPGLPPLPGLPALPPSPGFPGMAGAQSSPSPSQQPAKTCLEPLILAEPCVSYLTNSSVPAPPRTCCDGFRSLVGGGDRICLCHAIMGDLGTFAGGTIDQHVHTAGASSDVHRQV